MSVSYTQAGFSVVSLYTDTAQGTGHPTIKTLEVPNINWREDYTIVDSTTQEALMLQTSGTSLTQYEKVRFGRQDIANVYRNTDSATTAQLPDKRGVQVMLELREVYAATSESTGMVYDLPCTARLVLRMPYNAVIANTIIYDMVLRLAGMYGSYRTSATFNPVSEIKSVADSVRGDLTPKASYQG